jgi:ATP-binding cassette, subfamily B, bacterial PglK
VILLVLISHQFQQNVQHLLPTLGVLGLASIRLIPAANVFSSTLIALRFHRDSVSRLFHDVTDFQNYTNTEAEVLPEVPEQFERLTINAVSFNYLDAKNNALNQITLEISRGESIGLIGSSGSGKSTLIDTMLGLLKPQKGRIKFSGKALDQSLKTWQNHVEYLPQQLFIIDNTLRRNVALGIQENKIKARLDDLVEQLPEGLDTSLGEGGIRLSGGQRQRVALARAFYHERDVLVMDEATSALDNEPEREIVKEIQHLKGKVTMIVVAHRYATVQHCDRIYKIDNGAIVAVGKPSDLL